MSDTDLLAYYYPQWHPDPVNDRIHRPGWTEWELLITQPRTPRFPGHQPPGRPAGGPADESDPQVAAAKVRAAAAAGLTGFIVDWYWYRGAPFLNGFLDRGLLPALAANPPGFRFALVWANHPWLDLFPAGRRYQSVLMPAPRGGRDFDAATEHLIERYLTHPAYWRIDGRCYFSILDVPRLVHEFGSLSLARGALERFRCRAQAAGAELHLNLCGNGFWRSESDVYAALGADSVTHYNWTLMPGNSVDSYPATPYTRAATRAKRGWADAPARYGKPYLPNVTVGWDPTARCEPWEHDHWRGYPYTSVLSGRDPELFGASVRDALELAPRVGPNAVTVNAWNEWTGGSYLEADEQGTPYLDEIRRLRHPARGITHRGAERPVPLTRRVREQATVTA